MEWPWPHRRCIYCLRDSVPMSRSHLFPLSVGGFLWARTQCADCNGRLGHEVDAAVTRDDSIRWAMDQLRDDIPELAEGGAYEGRSEHGVVRATLREGDFVVRPSSEGGVLTQSTEDASRSLRTMLKRAGKSDEEIARALVIAANAPEDVPTRVSEHLTVVHRQSPPFHVALTGAQVSEAFPAQLAFHALTLWLGASIYNETLNGLREALRTGAPESEWHLTERLLSGTRQYLPSHLVGIAEGEPHLVVQVRLFWMLVWRVHFLQAAAKIEPNALSLDLKAKTVAAV